MKSLNERRTRSEPSAPIEAPVTLLRPAAGGRPRRNLRACWLVRSPRRFETVTEVLPSYSICITHVKEQNNRLNSSKLLEYSQFKIIPK